MQSTCVICKSQIDIPYRAGMMQYIPQICSEKCFTKLLTQKSGDWKENVIVNDGRIERAPEPDINRRSSYERDFEAYLQRNKLRYLYEPCSFLLASGKWYIPDFIIFTPDIRVVETKGIFEPGAKVKFKAFCEEFGLKTYLVDLPILKMLRGGS